MYDSRPETVAHIEQVYSYSVEFCQRLLVAFPSLFTLRFCQGFLEQVKGHDTSKLVEPELSYVNMREPLLKGVEYGSEEYARVAQLSLPGIQHHIRCNPHHPEFWAKTDEERGNGVAVSRMPFSFEMEMLIDWQTAGQRHLNGSFKNSVRVNQERLGFDDETAGFYLEVGKLMGWIEDSS